MLKVGIEDLHQSTLKFTQMYREQSKSAFTEEIYLNKIIPKMSAKVGRKYPYTVKIPKSVNEMLQGDFRPSKVLTIDKPFEGPYGEMWFGDATEGMLLMCGYENGDSRYPCNIALGDKDIHAILVGATGQGKSVTQNALIYGANYVYPPWELNFILCDAKIVEFKSIALNNPMPQVIAVGATGDADYLISVLDAQKTAMDKRNNVFAKVAEEFVEIKQNGKKTYKQKSELTAEEFAIYENPSLAPVDENGRYKIEIKTTGCKKISEFKKITGLAMPQVIIDIDEFQAMFAGAKKKAGEIAKLLDAFARLGRNTGYHLLLASQEIGSDIPKATLSNIKIRMAMGCLKNVSSAILGNDKGYDNYGKQGHMYINTGGGEDSKGDNNILFRVPYADPIAGKMAKAGIDLGKKLGVTPVMSFYDEESVIFQEHLKDYLKQFTVGKDRILLGEPSFVMEDKDQIVKLMMNGQDMENILILAPTEDNQVRHILNILGNFELTPGITNIVNCNVPLLEKMLNFKEKANFYSEDRQYSTSNEDGFHAIARETVYRRRMLLEADKMIYEGDEEVTEVTEKFFNEKFADEPELNTKLNHFRFSKFIYLQTYDASYQMGLGFVDKPDGSVLKLNEDMIENAALTVRLAASIGCNEKFSSFEDLPPAYFWDLGIQNELDFGRSANPRAMEKFVRVLQDASTAACRFILVTRTMTDIVALMNGIRWTILDSAPSGEISKIKCEFYPDTVSSRLAVLWDKSNVEVPVQKFKKLMLTGEIVK